MFAIEMLPASNGDCLWIEYGSPGKTRRVLIDGGVSPTCQSIVQRAGTAKCEFELLVVSHVDADHIEGIVKLLANLPPNIRFKEIWFNGWKHLPAPPRSRLGGPQGEMLTYLIEASKIAWNGRFGGNAVATSDAGPLPVHNFSGLDLTVLSPGMEELRRLRPKWKKECEDAGLIPGSKRAAKQALLASAKLRPRRLGTRLPDLRRLASAPFKHDTGVANGSSIALLAEFEGKRVLLCADAFPRVLETSIDRLVQERGLQRLQLDACKVSHHGSEFNTSSGLLEKIRCARFLFSTNGAVSHHPGPAAIARILLAAPPRRELRFNYLSEDNRPWTLRENQLRFKYDAHFPAGAPGHRVEL